MFWNLKRIYLCIGSYELRPHNEAGGGGTPGFSLIV